MTYKPLLMTVTEVQKETGLSAITIIGLIESGKLPALKENASYLIPIIYLTKLNKSINLDELIDPRYVYDPSKIEAKKQ